MKTILLTTVVYFGLGHGNYLLNSTQVCDNDVEGNLIAAPKLKEFEEPIFREEIIYSDVKATVYHARGEQTDDTPLMTADGSIIDTTRVNKLRWVAISRDMLWLKTSKYNYTGKLRLGDTIWVSYDREAVIQMAIQKKKNPDDLLKKFDKTVGWWVVKDTMGDYFWKAETSDSTKIDPATIDPNFYKIKDGVLYRKCVQRKWIDFLQDHRTGMLEYWNKSLIITKRRKVKDHKLIAVNG